MTTTHPLDSVSTHHTLLQSKYGSRNVFVTMLYGSQNYEMATPNSDVDTKVMVLPSFGDFAMKERWLSVEEELPCGLSTVKDVRGMCENFLKANINFLECLHTRYYVANPYYAHAYQYLRNNRHLVSDANPYKLMHAAAGMASQKFHALEKPFESKAEVLAKYGYDPKQLHHLCRLRVFMQDYMRYGQFERCLVPDEPSYSWLLSLKTHPLTLDDARREAKFAMEGVDHFVKTVVPAKFEKNPKSAEVAKDFLHDFCLRLLRDHLTNELQHADSLNWEALT